jgi:hypothetical protein
VRHSDVEFNFSITITITITISDTNAGTISHTDTGSIPISDTSSIPIPISDGAISISSPCERRCDSKFFSQDFGLHFLLLKQILSKTMELGLWIRADSTFCRGKRQPHA